MCEYASFSVAPPPLFARERGIYSDELTIHTERQWYSHTRLVANANRPEGISAFPVTPYHTPKPKPSTLKYIYIYIFYFLNSSGLVSKTLFANERGGPVIICQLHSKKNLEILVQVHLLLRRTGGVGLPFY